MLLDFDKVQKLIISDVEVSELAEGRLENRAIEIFTADKGKIVITFTGTDLRLFGEGEKEYKKEAIYGRETD